MFNFDQKQKREFLQAAFVLCKKNGFIPDYETDVFCDGTRKFYSDWGGDVKLAQALDAGKNQVSAAISDFMRWIGEKRKSAELASLNAIKTKHLIEVDRVGVTLEIPFGRQDKARLKFEAQGKIDPESEAFEIEEFYGELFNKCWRGYLALTNRPELFQMGGVATQYEAQSGDTNGVFQMTSIIVNVQGGKRDFKVKGDKFPVHGVRVFPEVLAKAGIDPATIETEKYIVGTATYQNKANGEPHKVLAIVVGGVGL